MERLQRATEHPSRCLRGFVPASPPRRLAVAHKNGDDGGPKTENAARRRRFRSAIADCRTYSRDSTALTRLRRRCSAVRPASRPKAPANKAKLPGSGTLEVVLEIEKVPVGLQ